MKGMNTQQRLEDISKRAGLSIDICRRVLNAEKESAVESLKRGERTALIGRVTLRPEMRQKYGIGGTIRNVIKIKAAVSESLEASLSDVTEFVKEESDNTEEDACVRVSQIQSFL